MIEFGFHTDGSDVVIAVKPSRHQLWHYYRHTFGDRAVADVMCNHLLAGIERRIEGLVQRAYQQGWSDKASKRRKKDCFTSCINSTGDPAW